MAEQANDVLWVVSQQMKGMGFRYARPTTLANETGFTRAEVQLALYILRKNGTVGCRRDGRWYKVHARECSGPSTEQFSPKLGAASEEVLKGERGC